MRILITGGRGFIGGRLGQHLHNAGHQVILGSRKASGPPDWLPLAEVCETEWQKVPVLAQICNRVDVVIHAAGMNAQDCSADPTAALEFNGLATARLLTAAVRTGVKRFIYLSTAHVYANPLVGDISEATCPRNLHPYASSHLAGENVVLDATLRGYIDGIALRLSNAYGAPTHMRSNCWMLLVNDLCRQAVENRKLVLRSSGLQQRDFIAMTEVCRVVEHMSTRNFETPQANVFNVGSGVSMTILEMAQLVQQRCKLVLGFEPELHRSATGSDEEHQLLKYRPDRLASIGVAVGIDNVSEIDNLLAFCRMSSRQIRHESE